MERVGKKYVSLLIYIGRLLLVFVILYFFITKGLFYIMPFFIAFIITLLIEDPVSFLERRLRAPRGLATIIILLLFIMIFGTLIFFLLSRIITETLNFSHNLPNQETILSFVNELQYKVQNQYNRLPPNVIKIMENSLGKNIEGIIKTGTDLITNTLQALVQSIINLVASLPHLFAFTLITIISTYFMTKDRRSITCFITRQMPSGWDVKIKSVKNDLFGAFVGLVKAQAILIGLTFMQLLIGYTLMGLNYALFAALMTALVDALPVFGTGAVFVPWIVISLLTGNYHRAIQLSVLYGFILLVRQILEPKLVGRGVGLHPLAALMSMYIGLQLLGIIGMLLGPVLMIIWKALQKANIIPQWK